MKICSLPAGTGGVAFYRMQQPLRSLQKQGHEIFIFDHTKHDGNRLYQQQKYADIMIYQCPWSQGVLEAVKHVKNSDAYGKKQKVVVEMDDNLFDVDPWNEKYNMFGMEEKMVTVPAYDKFTQKKFITAAKKHNWMRVKTNKDGSMCFDMWRDGYTEFSLEENALKHQATGELLNIVDLITVTTPELGKQLRKIAPKTKIAVLPNYIDFDRWLPMEKNDTEEIRLGWQGGSAHFDDIRLILPALEDLHKKYNSGKKKKLKFCFMGVEYSGLFDKFDNQVEHFPWHGDIETYPLIVREMKIDIGLAPLKNTTFNKGKSPLKWCEYSALKIPTVASEIVYNPYISHGKTGLIARDDEWFDRIDELIQDKEKRQSISEKAYNRVKSKYGNDNNALWLSALKDIL